MASRPIDPPSEIAATAATLLTGSRFPEAGKGGCLRSWKEIAAYLDRDPRTVQRWEKTEALPIHRHLHSVNGSVYAFTKDLDAWLAARTLRAASAVATPTEAVPEVFTAEPQTVATGSGRPARPQRLAIGLMAVVLLLAVAVWIAREGATSRNIKSNFEPMPFATLAGEQVSPSFSPDGKRVAFAWSRAIGKPFVLRIRSVAGSEDRQLTPAGLTAFSPAWSPDGKQIAFLSSTAMSEHPDLWMARLDGSQPFKVTATGGDGWPWYRAIAWTPDGKSLVTVGRDQSEETNSLFLYSLLNLKRKKLTNPPPGFSDYFPAVSPDGGDLLFTRFGKGTAALYSIHLKPLEGNARILYPDLLRSSNGLASCWDRTGKFVYIAANMGGIGKPFRTSADQLGESTPAMLASLSNGVGDVASGSASGELIFVSEFSDANLWRVRVDGKEEPQQYEGAFVSTRDEMAAQYSPDGSRIAFESNRSGFPQIWVARRDGSDMVAVTSSKGSVTGSPNWSPDAKYLAFDTRVKGKANIFIVPAAGGNATEVTHGNEPNVVPSWSRDGRWIYFASPRDGVPQVWKIHPDGTGRFQVTRQGGFAAQESFDGRFLYYTKNHDLVTSLWRTSTSGGEERRIAAFVQDRCFVVGRKGIYFASTSSPFSAPALVFQSFNSPSVAVLRQLAKPITYSLSVSPDEQEITFGERDSYGAYLEIVRGLQ